MPPPRFVIPVEIIDNATERQSRERIQEETRQHDSADLAAQIGINEATQVIKWHTWLQSWFIGVGTVLLFATLGLTGWANYIAHMAVYNAKKIGEIEMRAYLGNKGIQVRKVSEMAIGIALRFNNSGKTPAYRPVFQMLPFKIPVGDPPPEMDQLEVDIKKFYGTIGSDSNELTPDVLLTFDDLELAIAGSVKIGIYGRADYLDIFEGPQKTRFCYAVVPRVAVSVLKESVIDHKLFDFFVFGPNNDST